MITKFFTVLCLVLLTQAAMGSIGLKPNARGIECEIGASLYPNDFLVVETDSIGRKIELRAEYNGLSETTQAFDIQYIANAAQPNSIRHISIYFKPTNLKDVELIAMNVSPNELKEPNGKFHAPGFALVMHKDGTIKHLYSSCLVNLL